MSENIFIKSRMPNLAFQFVTTVPASPKEGTAYFDAATNKLYVYNGTDWKSTTLS